ncbi:MAG: hypothetical protein M1821_009866 [Bathelium mastoideum]|nr:MAG: hypothetical protein M1821_009866 [Bathelium mastoideum]KAI9690376.1 MAG: hypothetical protein M1822_009338 [Bathelium mastoideum]
MSPVLPANGHPLPNANGSYLRPRKYPNSTSKRMRLRNIILTILTIIGTFLLLHRYAGKHGATVVQNGQPRIAKVTALYGHPHPLYERAIRSHKEHNKRHGYPQYVLDRQLTNGYWNKFAYLLHLVIQELAKPESTRIEWLFWTDPNVILLNPNIPLSIFLPPSSLTDINLLVTKDRTGLSPSAFFLRVSEDSMRLLVSILAQPALDPDETSKAYAKDQELFQKVAHSDEHRRGMLYTPRPWFNAAQRRAHPGDNNNNGDSNGDGDGNGSSAEAAAVFEGAPGALLVTFPRLNGDRWQSMAAYLDRVEARASAFRVPLARTTYLADTAAYWERVYGARELLWNSEELLRPVRDWNEKYPGIEYAMDKVADMLAAEAEQADVLEEAVRGLQGEYDRVSKEEEKSRKEYHAWRAQMTEHELELTKEMEGDLKKEKEDKGRIKP